MKFSTLVLSGLLALNLCHPAMADWTPMIGNGVGSGESASAACNHAVNNAENNLGTCPGSVSDESCTSTASDQGENGLYSCTSQCTAACIY